MTNNFITNKGGQNLRKRLRTLIQKCVELDFLVGFFYFSGWEEIYRALKDNPDLKLKILVGLDVDHHAGQIIEYADPKAESRSRDEIAENFYVSMEKAINDESFDTAEFYEQVVFFLELIENGRLEIRKTLDPNHAKLYLFALKQEYAETQNQDGRFITGSSNLTRAGLTGQYEFNVEIGDYGWDDAKAYFDDLWRTAVSITEHIQRKQDLIRIIRDRTQVAEITPFEAYTLVIKTYLNLMEQKKIKPHVQRLLEERGYISYQYQIDAVNQALSILDQYNGVIIADVVGLGKSVIACLLAGNLIGRGLVLCSPTLMGDKNGTSGWRKYLKDFNLFDWEVYSVGKLDRVVEYLAEYGDDIETIIVDEAHRFRNEDTAGYEALSEICKNRKVILLTATPFNNAPSDIFALLKLFIPPGKSTITLDEDLANRFSHYTQHFKRISFITRYHNAGGKKQRRAEKYYSALFDIPLPVDLQIVHRYAQQLAEEIRSVIEPVLIRRNRLDLKNDPMYSQEVTELSEIADPVELFFELTPQQSVFYDQVVNDYFGEAGAFHGAIYQPFVYERGIDAFPSELDEEGNRTFQQQRNLYDFMRRLLVKRFESSFGSFAQSIQNFIRVHESVLAFIENSGGRYVLDRNLIEKFYEAEADEINVALDNFIRKLDEKEKLNPKHDRIYVIDEFDWAQEFIRDIESDLALLRKIERQIVELKLVEEDPKSARLVEELERILDRREKTGAPQRKVVIFTEYRDTVRHLRPILEGAFPGKVLSIEGNITGAIEREILENFDASIPTEKQKNNYQIMLTSDKMSEGVNLNRAGAIVNYDIPWNPTRVIQRVGRINRIGKKLFQTLYIYNFFPTEKGADIVHSREIASEKMYLIHNTLGEDAKIFDPDEIPTQSELFRRVNRNPEEEEEESLLTRLRREYFEIASKYPDVIRRVEKFPPRVKTAKKANENALFVFRRKGLGMFTHAVMNTLQEKPTVSVPLFEDAIEYIVCDIDTPRLPLSDRFWKSYKAIKQHRDVKPSHHSDNSLEVKALNNLQSGLENWKQEFEDYVPFIRTLVRDLQEYQTLPKYTLRRLTSVNLVSGISQKRLNKFRYELNRLRRELGENYLEELEERLCDFRSEIIIAVELRPYF